MQTPTDIPSLRDPALTARLQQLMDAKTKPLGALGRLERLAVQLGQILGTPWPALRQPQMIVFAADHGLTKQGVSAYPSDVTWQMVENFLAGGAAVSVLARQHQIALSVVDMGVAHDLRPRPGLIDRKVAWGTADASVSAAMSPEQCQQAMDAGAEVVRQSPGNSLLLGEMGIGNTSSASLLMSRLLGLPLAVCVGRGTGLDDQGLARKQAVLTRSMTLHLHAQTPLAALAAFGGFEIAGMVGAILQAASERRVIVVDGFITTAAVLVAARLAPAVLERCVFAHVSAEQGHQSMLKALQVEPLMQLGLRLGEGSGAALAWPLLVSACQILAEMASFDSAGVATAQGTAPA